MVTLPSLGRIRGGGGVVTRPPLDLFRTQSEELSKLPPLSTNAKRA